MNSLRLTIKSNPLYIAENPQNTKILHARYNMYTVLNRHYVTHFLGQYLNIFLFALSQLLLNMLPGFGNAVESCRHLKSIKEKNNNA